MKKSILFLVLSVFFYLSSGYCMPSYSSFCNVLTEQDDWGSEKCTGASMQTPMGTMVSAEKKYKKGSKIVEVTLIWGISATTMWIPYQSYMQMETDENYIKVTKIKGYNTAISYDKKTHTGTILVGFKSKLDPSVVSAVLGFNFSNMGWKEALDFAKKFDWKKVEKLISH